MTPTHRARMVWGVSFGIAAIVIGALVALAR
jgi:hypothetical protein